MSKSAKSQCLVMLLMLAVLSLSTSAMATVLRDPNPDNKQSAGAPFSFKSFGKQFTRGLMNVGFCWLEVPYQIKARLTDPDLNQPDAILTQVYNVICGTCEGTVETVERFTGGIVEVAFSPFPSYEPLMNPPYPPYLLFMNKTQAGPTKASAPAVPAK